MTTPAAVSFKYSLVSDDKALAYHLLTTTNPRGLQLGSFYLLPSQPHGIEQLSKISF